jgi:hypothetical protein
MMRVTNGAESQGTSVDQLFLEFGLKAKLHESHRIVRLYQRVATRCDLIGSISN